MKNSHLSARVKELRNRKGISQNTLAEESALSLRTIQRIENGETNPTGDSLKRLSKALNVNLDELIDRSIKENNKYLIYLNLSALTFIFFPLLGILVPFILWTSKKDKIKNINKLGTDLINFEIGWTMVLLFTPLLLFLFTKIGILESLTFGLIFTFTGIMYLLNFILILLNTLRISNGQNVTYYPVIKLLKE